MNPSYTNSFGSAENVVSSQGDFDGSGSGVGGSRVISSSKGDVILAPSGKSGGGSKRRAWIIAAAVLCLVAVVAGVGAVVVNLGNKNEVSKNDVSNEKYKMALRIKEVIEDYGSAQKEIIGIYNNSGDDGVQTYINGVMDCGKVDDNLLLTCNLVRQFYERTISEYVFFSNAECYVNGYDVDCAIEKYGAEQYAEVMESAASSSAVLGRLQNETTLSLVESTLSKYQNTESEKGDDA